MRLKTQCFTPYIEAVLRQRKRAKRITSNISPWAWIPTLYFAESIPYSIVNNVSVTMFTKMGVPNGDMAMFTSLLYLPWVIKPPWSSFVDILRTKRWWIVTMQALMSLVFILLTFTLPYPSPNIIASGNTPVSMFTLTLVPFIITAFASATHDIAADGFYTLALNPSQQSFSVGIRSTFYRFVSIFGQGVLVFVVGYLELRMGNIPLSWMITLGITSVSFAIITIYHTFFIPYPQQDKGKVGATGVHAKDIVLEFGHTSATYFKKLGLWIAIVLMLLYRLPETFLLKMAVPFLADNSADGGLAMSTQEVGLVYGTIGVIALTIGGIIGGIVASNWGLKKSFWPMAACVTLPCLTFVYLSMFLPHNVIIISACVTVEQFGYGFGFTVYMLHMIYFSEDEFRTAHYAICTAFMALSMMILGMFAGYLQEWLGYEHFFWLVIACCLATAMVTLIIKVDLHYGRKDPENVR